MANTAQMAERLPRGDGPLFCWKRRAVFLDRRVEVQFAPLPELENRCCRDGFGDRAQAEEGGRSRRGIVLQVGHAKTLRPTEFAFEDYSRRQPGNTVGGHETRDRPLDFLALLRSKARLVSGKS